MSTLHIGVAPGLLLALALAAGATGCSYWTIPDVAPREFVDSQQPERIRVVRADGSRTLIDAPQVQGDSLIGTIPDSGQPGMPLDQAAISLTDVDHVEIFRRSFYRTVALGAVPILTTGLGVLLLGY